MTSMERGILPAGISSLFSCTLTRCQSTKTDLSAFNAHSLAVLAQNGLAHAGGSA